MCIRDVGSGVRELYSSWVFEAGEVVWIVADVLEECVVLECGEVEQSRDWGTKGGGRGQTSELRRAWESWGEGSCVPLSKTKCLFGMFGSVQ